jgi:Leucine-rich repeat (LRR) protein/membrane-associated phospholipid phosphatase
MGWHPRSVVRFGGGGMELGAIRAGMMRLCRVRLLLLVAASVTCLGTLAFAQTGRLPFNPAPVTLAPISREVSVGVKNGLLTATFSDRTDDDVLKAVVPTLIAEGVQSINLAGAPVRDLTPLMAMTGLKALDLRGTHVRDVAPLAGLVGLQSLNLQFLGIRNLTPLAGLSALRSLNLCGTEIRNLDPLAGLISLQTLVVSVTKVKDLRPLSALRQLTTLDLASTGVGSIRPLAGMSKLRSLNLNGTPVSDVEPLVRMPNLQVLDLGGTQVSDILPLLHLRSLRSLNLEGTLVADATLLKELPDLQFLALGGSLVRDLAPFAKLGGGHAPAPGRDPDAEQPVLYWIEQANRAIKGTSTDPFQASRALALESIAVLDTVRSMSGSPAFLVRLPAPPGISMGSAIAAAAHATLSHLFPARGPALDAALSRALANEPAGPARGRARMFGKAIADGVIAMGDQAGRFGPPAPVPTSTIPGQWRPTPPDYLPPAGRGWVSLTPLVMVKADQFRVPPPPRPGSPAFRNARASVAALGAVRSAARTPEQTEIAQFWNDEAGTTTPVGHWNAITADVIGPLRLGTLAEAEIFAQLNVALADAAIAISDTKYAYLAWRPISAIRAGNDGDEPVPDWTPLLRTPNHPSYVSGHSSFSTAAATVLTARLGDQAFASTGTGMPGIVRHFASFQQAAEEASASRLYGGIHFPFDNEAGRALGRAVGEWIVGAFQHQTEDRGPFLMADNAADVPASDYRAIAGCALNNIAPVKAVMATVDDGQAFSLAVDDRGLFSLPAPFRGLAGHHAIVLAATSITGRTNTLHLEVDGDIVIPAR